MDPETRAAVVARAADAYPDEDETHGIEHLDRTLALAAHLTAAEGADPEVVELGAALHQLHDGDAAAAVLREFGADEELIGAVVHCVEASDLGVEAETTEAAVVFDADKLQVVGPFGIVREIACDVGARGKSFRAAVEHTREIERRCYEALCTETGRAIGRRHHELLDEFWAAFEELDSVTFAGPDGAAFAGR